MIICICIIIWTYFLMLSDRTLLFQLPVSIHVLDVFGRTSVRMTCGGFYVLVETGNMPINIQKPSQLSGSFGRSYGGSAKMRGSFKNRLGISNYQHIWININLCIKNYNQTQPKHSKKQTTSQVFLNFSWFFHQTSESISPKKEQSYRSSTGRTEDTRSQKDLQIHGGPPGHGVCAVKTRRRIGGIFGPMGPLLTKSHGFGSLFLMPSIKNHRIWRYLLDTHTPRLQVFAYYISSVGRFSVKPIPAPPVRACVECTDVAVASKQQRAHAKLNFAGENRQTCGALNVFSKIQVDSDND